MPSQPELLNTTSLVPVIVVPGGLRKTVQMIETYVKGGEIEQAIGLASWYCFDSQFSCPSPKRKRYILKRLWFCLDELFTKRLDEQITDQVRFPGGFMEADVKTYDLIQAELIGDIHRSHRFSRLLGNCESLVLMMLENESFFTAEGFRILTDRLTQSEDGA